MKFTVFCVWWLIDFMLPRVLSVLQLANNPQMYWRYDNMIVQLRDSEKKLLQNKLFQALQLFSPISLRKESTTCFAALPSRACFVKFSEFILACIVFLLYIVLEIFGLGHCFQSLFSFEEKLFFFQVIFLWKKKMERFDGRRVTRYNVNQYLSRAASVQKTLSTILASTVVRKNPLGTQTRQRNLSLQP